MTLQNVKSPSLLPRQRQNTNHARVSSIVQFLAEMFQYYYKKIIITRLPYFGVKLSCFCLMVVVVGRWQPTLM